MKRFILASGSPRRKEILENAGYRFEVETSDKEMGISKNDVPEKLALANAVIKASDVYKRLSDKQAVVLGADTVVAIESTILGKPKDRDDAERTLRLLSGKTHVVITGYALVSGNMWESGSVKTEVEFNELSDESIREYLDSGLYVGKAGSYGIQDGFGLVKRYIGDYENVVGLPIRVIDEKIKEFLK